MGLVGRPDLNQFDGVEVLPGALRLAQFGDSDGNLGAYSFSAATLNTFGDDNRIVSMPYDFSFIRTIAGAKWVAPLAARSIVLDNILTYFGAEYPFEGSPVLPGAVFALSVFPNPFNPVTRLDYTIAGPGHLNLKIYNLRGELVRTLIDGRVRTSGHVMWDGTDNGGAQVSSGVYFSEARMGTEILVHKVTLVK